MVAFALLLWFDFFHGNLFDATLGHIVRKHCVKIWDGRRKHNAMSRKRLIVNLR